jgi:glycosyltransferase involved in cell wall biosynthesis
MKIVHLSAFEIQGGAARAAHRLHRGLLALGADSRMVVAEKQSADPLVTRVPPGPSRAEQRAARDWRRIQEYSINRRRTPLSNTQFSLPAPGRDLAGIPAILAAELVQLHWVTGLLSPPGLAQVQRLGTPVVWTLHDQRAFTGGCHYAAGCRGYETDCARCPQLEEDPHELTQAALADARELLAAGPMAVVSPSRWLADCARRSALFRAARVEVIPYGIETAVFRPQSAPAARARFGFTPEGIHLLFGASYHAEKRKGVGLLVEAVRLLLERPEPRRLAAAGRLRFITFGQASGDLAASGLPITSLGVLDRDDQVAALYAAADAVLLPSLEDNLPNVLLEAMCCGTPAISFAVGGVPDVVREGENGVLVRPADVPGLAAAIEGFLLDPPQRQRLREACAREAPARFALEVQARRYVELYQELHADATPARRPPARRQLAGQVTGPGPRLKALQPLLRRQALLEQCRGFWRKLGFGSA